MVGPRKWLKSHSLFVDKKFADNEGVDGKWYLGSKENPINLTSAVMKPWYDEVKPPRLGEEGYDERNIWNPITFDNFKSNVKRLAPLFLNGPRNASNAINPPRSQTGGVSVGRATSNSNSNDTEYATVNANNSTHGSKATITDAFNVDEDDVSYSEGTVEAGDLHRGTICLAYTQCVYSVGHKANVQTTTRKCHIIIQPVSGWSISDESAKGDFVTLTSNGDALVLNVKANPVLFNPTTARSILIDSGLFNGVYNDNRLSSHPAVSSLGEAIAQGTLMMDGGNEVPSHTFTIPLLSSFKSVCAVEGLHIDRVPQVSCSNQSYFINQ